MRRFVFFALMLVAVVGGGLVAYGYASGERARSDCGGTVVCPLTGEEVCKDACPLLDPDRADCPGKIECPLTGELVCRDKCPLGKQDPGDDRPSCCQQAE